MREISPAYNVTSDEFLKLVRPEFLPLVETIRNQKQIKVRPVPSASLVDLDE